MPVFLDTSALFKRYQVENGTEVVNKLIEKGAGNLFISSLTIVEITSNLKRLCAVDKVTDESQYQDQRLFFFHDLDDLDIIVLGITTSDIIKADELIQKRYMKPVDALQLAIALNNFPADLTFVSADKKLCDIAQDEGVKALNPNQS
jgi:predicted nucleic acid-binding protein